MHFVGLNTRKKPLDSIPVRQALNHAVDKSAIINSVLAGLAVPVPGPLFPEARGFDLGVHVSTGCADWTPASLEAAFVNDLAAWAAVFPSVVPQRGNRTHCIAWSDWATQPKVERAQGIRYDMNYYYWPGDWVLNRPGFMTGSGMVVDGGLTAQ